MAADKEHWKWRNKGEEHRIPRCGEERTRGKAEAYTMYHGAVVGWGVLCTPHTEGSTRKKECQSMFCAPVRAVTRKWTSWVCREVGKESTSTVSASGGERPVGTATHQGKGFMGSTRAGGERPLFAERFRQQSTQVSCHTPPPLPQCRLKCPTSACWDMWASRSMWPNPHCVLQHQSLIGARAAEGDGHTVHTLQI